MTRASVAVIDDAGLERETFRDRKLELFVWSRGGHITGFELHYQIHSADEWSLRWTDTEGTTYHRIDRRSYLKGRKEGRVMKRIESEFPDVRDMHAEFVVRGRSIDDSIRAIVLSRLSQEMRGSNR